MGLYFCQKLAIVQELPCMIREWVIGQVLIVMMKDLSLSNSVIMELLLVFIVMKVILYV